jgi:pSer/pThr/pTyr-binding forkhead associated (FHA) protein
MRQLTVLFNGKKQAVYLLDEPHVVIGRGRSAHIGLDGNPIVSRQHAVIRQELDSHVLEDLGGANGTFVNDTKVESVRLRIGDRVVLGKHTLRYEESTGEGVSLKGAVASEDSPEDQNATAAVPAMAQGAAPWDSPMAAPMSPGSEATMAASKEQLEALLEQMKLKAEPHLSINRGGQIELIPVGDEPLLIGHRPDCKVRLEGSRWFGKLAASVIREGEQHWLVAHSPFWNPVVVGSSKVQKRRKLKDGGRFTVGDVKARFSLGEQD